MQVQHLPSLTGGAMRADGEAKPVLTGVWIPSSLRRSDFAVCQLRISQLECEWDSIAPSTDISLQPTRLLRLKVEEEC